MEIGSLEFQLGRAYLLGMSRHLAQRTIMVGLGPPDDIEDAFFFYTHGSTTPTVAPYPPKTDTFAVHRNGPPATLQTSLTDTPLSLLVCVTQNGAWSGPYTIPIATGRVMLSPSILAEIETTFTSLTVGLYQAAPPRS